MKILKRFNLFKKNKLTSLDVDEKKTHIKPIDSSKELLENDSKDRSLYNYYDFYRKRDYFDRFRTTYKGTTLLSYLLSVSSAYLSLPFISAWLSTELPLVAVLPIGITVMLLLEIIKHLTVNQSARTILTYSQVPIITLPIAIMCFCGSVYMCINGVKTQAQEKYTPPTSQDISTQYDNQISQLKKDNKRIFDTNNWKGRLNESSKAGKAYAANEVLLSELQKKASKERSSKLDAAITKYDASHTQVHSFRLYVGYFVEGGIFLCLVFGLVYKYKSHLEHIIRIGSKYFESNSHSPQYSQVGFASNSLVESSATPQNQIGFRRDDISDSKPQITAANTDVTSVTKEACNDVDTSVTTVIPSHFKTTGKLKTHQQIENGLRNYLGFKRRGERDATTVNARINYFQYMRDLMKAQDTFQIEEIVFDVEAWKNRKEVQDD